jgi:hypothetical protein
MALEKITSALVAKFNESKKQMEYYLIPPDRTWWLGDTDVIINAEQVFVVELPALSQEEYTLKAITTLREKQKAAYEEASRTAARLEEKIKELQLLTWQADPSVIDSNDLVLQPIQEEVEEESDPVQDKIILTNKYREIILTNKYQPQVPVGDLDFEQADLEIVADTLSEDVWPESEDEIEDSEYKSYIDQTWE